MYAKTMITTNLVWSGLISVLLSQRAGPSRSNLANGGGCLLRSRRNHSSYCRRRYAPIKVTDRFSYDQFVINCTHLVCLQYKNKYLSLNPNFRWCKQPMVPATPSTPSPLVALAPNATNGLSLAAVRPEPSFVQDNRESLEAAESLVQLAQGKPLLSVFRLADESNMGSLNALCVGPNVGSRAGSYTQRCDYSVDVQHESFLFPFAADNKEPTWKPPKATQTVDRELPAPTPSISGNAVAEPITAEGRSSPRATRSCKGKKYQELMSRMYPNAHAPQTKRSPGARMQKDNQKFPKPATVAAGGDDQTGFLYSNTAMPELDPLAIDALMMELDSKISDLPAMNVGDFCILLNSEKKRKKSFSK